MKLNPLSKILTILKSKRGETLFEAVVSVLIFTVLIVAVSMVLIVSMEVTGNANRVARIMHGEASATTIGESVTLPHDGREINIATADSVIVFSIEDEELFSFPVKLYESEVYGFVAFEVVDAQNGP